MCSYVDTKEEKENSRMVLGREGVPAGSPVSVRGCRLAGCGRPSWPVLQQWSLKLPPAWPWESEWGARQLEQLNTWGREESKRPRGERGTAHSCPPTYIPPFLPLAPLRCHPSLSTPLRLSLTPQDENSWSLAQKNPKFQMHPNRRQNNARIRTLGPPILNKITPSCWSHNTPGFI